MLDRMLRMSLLLDFYGALLTPRQQLCVELYFHQDMSLSEVAAELVISRQAVHDLIHRAAAILEDYERRLGLIGQHNRRRQTVDEVLELLDRVEDRCDVCEVEVAGIRSAVTDLV